MKKRELSIILIVCLAISGYIIYEYYMDYRFDENFKSQVKYFDSSLENYDLAINLYDSVTLSTEETIDKNNQVLIYFNSSIEDMEKSLIYRQKMLEVATDSVEKEYAELMIKLGNNSLKMIRLESEKYNLIISNENNTERLIIINNQLNQLYEEADYLDNEKEQLKLKNQEFDNRIRKIS